MKEIAGLEVAIFVWFLFFTPASVAADGPELAEMESAVLAAGGDWDAIEALLDTLSPEDRALVIATYPERIAELELVRQAIEESGANWTAGLNSVSILPPELRPGTGLLSLSAEEGGLVPRGRQDIRQRRRTCSPGATRGLGLEVHQRSRLDDPDQGPGTMRLMLGVRGSRGVRGADEASGN